MPNGLSPTQDGQGTSKLVPDPRNDDLEDNVTGDLKGVHTRGCVVRIFDMLVVFPILS